MRDGFGADYGMMHMPEVPRPQKKPKLSQIAPFVSPAVNQVSGDGDKYKEKYNMLKKRVHEVVVEVEELSGLLNKSKSWIEKLEAEKKYGYGY
jgi:hypothetical protein